MSRFVTAVVGVLLTTSHLAHAQTPVEPADEAYKRSVGLYEMALVAAVKSGGQRLAEKAAQVVPEVTLLTEPPVVHGFRLPGGLHFDIQAPDIQSTLVVMDMVTNARPPAPTAASGLARPGAAPRTVATGGVVEPDPMVLPAAAWSADYSAFVREALIDALLDSSGVLRLKDTEYLSISASGIEKPGANPLYRERKLILSILGSDLSAYRQGRISRDEAITRITEDRF